VFSVSHKLDIADNSGC